MDTVTHHLTHENNAEGNLREIREDVQVLGSD